MAHTNYLVVNVSYVRGRCKNCFEQQALVADTKQRNQADWLTRQSGLLALFCARYMLIIYIIGSCQLPTVSVP